MFYVFSFSIWRESDWDVFAAKKRRRDSSPDYKMGAEHDEELDTDQLQDQSDHNLAISHQLLRSTPSNARACNAGVSCQSTSTHLRYGLRMKSNLPILDDQSGKECPVFASFRAVVVHELSGALGLCSPDPIAPVRMTFNAVRRLGHHQMRRVFVQDVRDEVDRNGAIGKRR